MQNVAKFTHGMGLQNRPVRMFYGPSIAGLCGMCAFEKTAALTGAIASKVSRSNIELRGLSWDYAARWYSLISPVTTGLRRTDRRSATSQLGCVSISGGRCCRDWCGLCPL